jgi:tRNA 2-selenouridine synthase
MREITVEELQHNNNSVIIDIRSPIEFKDGSIPGAINIPLFTDEERQEIGTIFKQEGQEAAKWRAMERVSPKIPALLQEIKAKRSNGQELIIHCWRGGMRSKAVVTFLEFAGIYAMRLVGGYKAFRQYILAKMPEMYPQKAVVLHGLTGVGKTEVLKILKTQGYPTIDLEEMAGHRGSIFGTIGLEDGHNQKTFDSLLFKGLKEIQGADYYVIEAESKRIGKAVQPEELMDKKMQGLHIHIHTPFEERVKHLINEYVIPYEQEPWYQDKIASGIDKILKRIKNEEMKKQLISTLEEKNYQEMIRILLDEYYDPRYDHKRQEYDGEFIEVFADDFHDAARKVAAELENAKFQPAINTMPI